MSKGKTHIDETLNGFSNATLSFILFHFETLGYAGNSESVCLAPFCLLSFQPVEFQPCSRKEFRIEKICRNLSAVFRKCKKRGKMNQLPKYNVIKSKNT